MRIPTRKSEEDKRKLKADEPLHLTSAGILGLQRELARIQKEIPRVREELIETREMGDLSENAGYQIAKATLRRLQHREFQIQEDLKRVEEIVSGPRDTVELGATVTVRNGEMSFTYQLVGPRESHPGKGRISIDSPLGQLLRGHREGETVILERENGSVEYTIVKVE